MKRIANFFDRIEMNSLYAQHLTTFYHYEKKQFYNKTEIPKSDKIVFLLIPFILSILLYLGGLKFDKDYVNITLTCLSIFTGLLFSLLALVLGMIQENQKLDLSKINAEKLKAVKARIELTNHLFINIAFSLTLAIISILLVLLTQFNPPVVAHLLNKYEQFAIFKTSYKFIVNCAAYFLIIEFMLTLLMIVKRFTVIFITQTSNE